MSADPASTFEPHRGYLVGVAYRMLGSVADAEDIVQEAFLRWQGADRELVLEPRAYLARVVSRLCLDRLKSAEVRRQDYVGTWLPDPLVEDLVTDGEAERSAIAESVSVALMVTLERLSPLERAAFLMHDVFDMDYAVVAGVLERSEAACRQLTARAREHVRDGRPRFSPKAGAEERLIGAFTGAMMTGDTAALTALLAEDAVFYSDGGGKRHAALNPVYGRDRVVRFLVGVSKKRPPIDAERSRTARINGLPGFVLHTTEGVETLALEIAGDVIVRIYAVRNPDKLRHLA
ncbi:MAG: sigma-70 family RNA polymerase sigma factor [Polyangiaceae bacterium]